MVKTVGTLFIILKAQYQPCRDLIEKATGIEANTTKVRDFILKPERKERRGEKKLHQWLYQLFVETMI
jgi:hypothetical protein